MNRIARKIKPKHIICVGILLGITGAITMIINFIYFVPLTGGVPYLETKFFYTPSDLLTIINQYGEAGRKAYINISTSLDVLVPLFAGCFLWQLSSYLLMQVHREKYIKYSFIFGICTWLSDWCENISLITLIRQFPNCPITYAVIARILTSVKYISMFVLVGFIVYSLIIKNRTQKMYRNY